MPHIFEPRASVVFSAPKTRPLAAKLDMLLDFIVRRIIWDPLVPTNTSYNMDQAIRTLKKQDKDLG